MSRSPGRSMLFFVGVVFLSLHVFACGGGSSEVVISEATGGEESVEATGSSGGESPAESPSIGCDLFPEDNFWRADVSGLPVLPESDVYVESIGWDAALQADFGSGEYEGSRIGIPYTVVGGDQSSVDVSFEVPDESDPGPYPIPENAPVEGEPEIPDDGDRHVIVVERDSCTLYEMFNAAPNDDGSWSAFSGAVFDLSSNSLRPDTYTSADAAGLPILPGLVRYDEIEEGEINHALRFTVENTRDEYVWPARHQAGEPGDELPPMGLWLRLKADFDVSAYPEDVQIILRTMQKHGLILADNGTSMFVSGAPDERWNNDDLAAMRDITADNFEAVDVSSLIVDENSGQISQ